YRLLSEYFAYPAKFHFLDLGGWRRACRGGFGRKVEVVFYLGRSLPNLERTVDTSTFRLGCTPVINLFEQTAEPIPLTQTRHQYRVVPDVAYPEGMEVYSVDSVTCIDPHGEVKEFAPFYSHRHGVSTTADGVFWYAVRRPGTGANERGTEVFLQLV